MNSGPQAVAARQFNMKKVMQSVIGGGPDAFE